MCIVESSLRQIFNFGGLVDWKQCNIEVPYYLLSKSYSLDKRLTPLHGSFSTANVTQLAGGLSGVTIKTV